jgi:hypothetical protein
MILTWGEKGGELHPTKFKLFIDIKSSKWIIIKNNTQLTLTQPEMLATRMDESWTHYLCLDSKLELTIFFTSETHDFLNLVGSSSPPFSPHNLTYICK